MKKKVLFIIYSSDIKSGGGHYYTLLTLVEKLSNYIDFKILNVGLVYPKILQNNSIPSDYILITKNTYFSGIKKVSKYVNDFKPDIIHSFDLNALRVARSISYSYKAPLLFSKCGGGNGGKIIADADAYICFSEENVQHYNLYKKNNNPIHLIPNRATKIFSDQIRIKKIQEQYNLIGSKVLLRISRFSELHELSIMQAISLFKLIYKNNTNYRLLLIGMIQSENTYSRVVKECEGFPIDIITDDYYCKNASELLDVADIVIATGRSVMEASSLGKIIFCPVQGNLLPAPLNEQNFSLMSKFNFSGRTKGIDSNEEEIISMLENNSNKLSQFSLKMFDEEFNIDIVIPKYLKLYETLKYQKPTFKSSMNYIFDMLYFFKPNFK